MTLLETVIICGLLSLILLALALTTQQFYRGRARVQEVDREGQLLHSLSCSLARELEGCYQVDQVSPSLVLKVKDMADASRLPATYPDPAPDLTPLWDPSASLMTVTYRLDAPTSALMREITFADGRTSQQRVAESIDGFTVSNTTDRDFALALTYTASSGLQTIRQSVHLADD